MQKDLKKLFQKWQSNKATEEEISELEQMLKSEVHQQQLMELLADASVSNTYDNEITDERKNVLLQEVLGLIQSREQSASRRFSLRVASAVAAAVTVLVLAGLWLLDSPGTTSQQEVSNVVVIDKRYVKLPDGTSVTLNEGSTITYNAQEFGKQNREVVLSGEAFFDVTHAPDRPFIVETQGISTIVLGTAFNISAYANKPITVTVVRGKVRVSIVDKDETLLPDQELTIEPKTLAYERKAVHAEEKVEWMANYLVLDNVTMKEAVQMISKRYNTKVVLGDSSLTDCRISILFVKNESLSRVLETVSLAKGGDYTVQNNVATINGKCE